MRRSPHSAPSCVSIVVIALCAAGCSLFQEAPPRPVGNAVDAGDGDVGTDVDVADAGGDASTPTRTFVVTTSADDDDGTCDAAHCSFREALEAANAAVGGSRIEFEIPTSDAGHVDPPGAIDFYLIELGAPLPAVDDPVIIDGTTQPGFVEATGNPLIELRFAESDDTGLVLGGATSELHALALTGASDACLRIGADDVVVSSLWLGWSLSGGPAACAAGIAVSGDNVTLGGSEPSQRLRIHAASGPGVHFEPGAGNGHLENATLNVNLMNQVVRGGAEGILLEGDGNLVAAARVFGVDIGIVVGGKSNAIRGTAVGTDLTGPLPGPKVTTGILLEAGASAAVLENNFVGSVEGAGIVIEDQTSESSVRANFVGILRNGMSVGNGSDGIQIEGRNVLVDANMIGSNGGNGVYVEIPAALPGSSGITIVGNRIGTNDRGLDARPNGTSTQPQESAGIWLEAATAVQIGRPTRRSPRCEGACNLVSGNIGDGIYVGAAATEVRIQGNTIGLAFNGTTRISNGHNGVRIDGAESFTIGDKPAMLGACRDGCNVISGATSSSDSGGHNLSIESASNGDVLGNYLGISGDGSDIYLEVGGTHTSRTSLQLDRAASVFVRENVIAGATSGVVLLAASQCTVGDNWLGLTGSGASIDGAFAVAGVHVDSSSNNNTIEANTVAGSRDAGIEAFGSTNTFRENLVGVHTSGVAVANAGSGIRVGGTGILLENNVVSGNGAAGITVDSSGASNLAIVGNVIGLNPTGSSAIPNADEGIGPDSSGICTACRIEGNTVSGNGGDGMILRDGNFTVINNLVGTGPSGTGAFGNVGSGIIFEGSATGSIGEDGTGPNTIAHNSDAGVIVVGTARVSIRRNVIHDNGGLGIDISPTGQVNLNDDGDTDSGPNDRLNFPYIDYASEFGATNFMMTSPAGAVVDFYEADGASASPEGERWLGSCTEGSAQDAADYTWLYDEAAFGVENDAAYLDCDVSGVVIGTRVTATATVNGVTSEFMPIGIVVD